MSFFLYLQYRQKSCHLQIRDCGKYTNNCEQAPMINFVILHMISPEMCPNSASAVKFGYPENFSQKRLDFSGRMCYNIRVDGKTSNAPVAQLDRVTGYEPVGRGFESLPAHSDAHAVMHGHFSFKRYETADRRIPAAGLFIWGISFWAADTELTTAFGVIPLKSCFPNFNLHQRRS